MTLEELEEEWQRIKSGAMTRTTTHAPSDEPRRHEEHEDSHRDDPAQIPSAERHVEVHQQTNPESRHSQDS